MTQQAVTTTKALLFHNHYVPELTLMDEEYVSHSQNRSKVSLTVHDIKQSPTGSVIGAGRVLSEADKQDIRDFLNGEDEIKTGWLPSNLMMINSQQMVWYVPAKTRSMFIRQGDKQLQFKVKFPSLVFMANNSGTLKVAAYTGSGRPKLTQPLYHAPLWNIYADTRLCNGTAEITNIINVDAMQVWEDAMFNTMFTHSNHQNVLPKTKAGKQRAYISFIRAKAKAGTAFKSSEMTPLKMTLDQWAGK